MPILPDGRIQIRNIETGETKIINPDEASLYGISPSVLANMKAQQPVPQIQTPSVIPPSSRTPIPTPTVKPFDYASLVKEDTQANPSATINPENNKGMLTKVGEGTIDFVKGLFGSPARLGKGVGGSVTINQDQDTIKKMVEADSAIMDRNMQAANRARTAGNMEGYYRLIEENKKIAARMDEYTGRNVSETKQKAEKGMEDTIKGGVGTAAFFVPGGNTPLARIGTSALSGGMAGYGASEKGNELPDIVGGTVIGAGVGTAIEGAGWLKNVLKNRQNPVNTDNVLQKFGKKVKAGAAPIYEPASIYGAEKEKAINETLDKLGFKGSAADKYEQLAPKMRELSQKIDDYLAENATTVTKQELIDAFKKRLSSELRTGSLKSSTAQKEIQNYLNDLTKATGSNNFIKSGEIDTRNLANLKKLINQDSGGIFLKLQKGIPLTDKEKVILQARSAVDDVLKRVHPELKEMTVMQSHLFDAAESLNRARKTVPTTRIAGTTIPADVSQKAQDFTGNVIKGAGDTVAGAGKVAGVLPNIAIKAMQQPMVRNAVVSKTIEGINQKAQNQQPNIDQNTGQEEPNANLNTNQDHTSILPQPTSYRTGHSPEEWDKASQQAMAQGNDKAAEYYDKQFAKEVAYQKELSSKTVGGQVSKQRENLGKSGLLSIKEIEKLMKVDYASGKVGDLSPLTAQLVPGQFFSRKFDSAMYNAVDTLLRLRTGAQANPSEIRGYMTKIGPTFGDDEQTVIYKLNQLKNALQLELTSPGLNTKQTLPNIE